MEQATATQVTQTVARIKELDTHSIRITEIRKKIGYQKKNENHSEYLFMRTNCNDFFIDNSF